MTRRFAIALLALCLFVPVIVADVSDRPAPQLLLEELGGRTAVRVQLTLADGATQQVLLRETADAVLAERSGWDPSGESAFVTWTEAGQRWIAFSQDGGAKWADARPVQGALHLRAGRVEPGASMPSIHPELQATGQENLYLVQFVGAGLPQWRTAVQAAGAEILAHVPRNAHIVRMPIAVRESVRAMSFIERIEAYQPGYRLAPDVASWLEQDSVSQSLRDLRVMVFEWGPEAKGRLAAVATQLGGAVLKNTPSGHIVELRLGRQQLRQLLRHDDVMWVDFWTPQETDMDLVREDAGTDWLEDNFGYCGEGVRAEVMDAGIQEDHPDFDGIILHGGHDTSSHGTSTYGIVFGNGDRDGDGQAKGTGHMPCAQGIFADYGNVGDRYAHTQELKNSPYFASFQTNSWGDARTRAYTSVSHEMDDIIWRLDIAILQSQSNSGNQDSRPQAWSKNIISVGGIKHKDTLDTSDDDWTSGASIGPAADGRIKPDINYWYDNIYTTTTGSGYTSTFGGTSGATPEAAGVVGLMLQLWSENTWGNDPQGSTVFEKQPHASTIKAMAINYAHQYDFSGESDDLTRVHQGWGRPNVRLAKERSARNLVIDHDQPLAFDERVQYDVDVLSGETELKITMIYPDPPGTTSASLHRINDLNLKVTSPGGTIYWGNNGLKANNYSTPGGVANGLDTVENVFVLNPETGRWTVEIHAAEINQDAHLDTPVDDAVFSLIASGGGGSVCESPTADFLIAPNPAQISEEVSFDSTVSGGAGGPYSYAWDFNGDSTIDSTEADPVYVYNHAYDGLVVLTVQDVEGCPALVEHPITVTGPDLRYHDYTDLLEIEGNGNGAIDPGETWQVTVNLRNDGNGAAVGVDGTLVVDPVTAGPVVMISDQASFGDIDPAAIAAGLPAFQFRVGSAFPCGENVQFSLINISSSSPQVTYPDANNAFRLLVGGSGPHQLVWSDGFETSNGWSEVGTGEWQRGAPQGLGAGSSIPGQSTNPDPVTARTGSAVIGNDLNGAGTLPGNYENNSSSVFLSEVIDLSDAVLVELEFFRWLNVIPFDRAAFEVTGDGTNWTTVFETSDGATDSQWAQMNFDLRDIADRSPNFRMRFVLQADEQASASGWNVDDMTLSAITKNSCEPFGVASPGDVAGLMVNREPNGDLTLTWQPDCGAGTAYGVYRGDLETGYESLSPEAGMCAVSSSSAVVPAGAGQADFFLIVPNDGAFEGSYSTDSAATRRIPAAAACYPQDGIDACAP